MIQSLVILDLCSRRTWSGKFHDKRSAIVFEKRHFQNALRVRSNVKPAFSNSSGPEKLLFRDGLLWTLGRTVEIKLRFQITLA